MPILKYNNSLIDKTVEVFIPAYLRRDGTDKYIKGTIKAIVGPGQIPSAELIDRFYENASDAVLAGAIRPIKYSRLYIEYVSTELNITSAIVIPLNNKADGVEVTISL